jgi:hypothetical protein
MASRTSSAWNFEAFVSVEDTSAAAADPAHVSYTSAYGERETHTNTDSGMHDGLQWGKSAVELAAEGNSGRGHSEVLKVLGQHGARGALCYAAKNDLRDTIVKYAAFLSHDRGKDSQGRDNHDRVVRMSRALHERGIQVWIDDAEMSGDIDTKAIEGIDRSAIVLLFITLNFMVKVGGKGPMGEADFCRSVFNYAKQKKTAAKMLCVVMDSECLKNANWSGPVKMHMGGSLFFDFTTDDNFDVKVERLIARMRGIAAPADWETLEESNHCGQLVEILRERDAAKTRAEKPAAAKAFFAAAAKAVAEKDKIFHRKDEIFERRRERLIVESDSDGDYGEETCED